MKKIKRGITILLILALTATLVIAASYNWKGAELGDLSQYYETGSVGEAEAKPGYISTVVGDAGGTSYGIYMFASKAGTPYEFAKWLAKYPKGTLYRSIGETLVEAYEYNLYGEYIPGYGSNFNAKWTEIAENYHDEFYAAQKEYWLENNYSQLIKNIQAKYPAFNMDNYSIALKNVFWSRSVQQGLGGATKVISNAFNTLGGFKNQREEELIAAIYAECSKLDTATAANKMTDAVAYKYGVGGKSMSYYSGNSGDVQIGVYRRLHVNEPADAVVMFYQNGNYSTPNGVYQIRERANSQTHAVSGGALKSASEADNFTLTNFDSGYVTFSVGDKRLADNNGAVNMANADASNSQMWEIADGYLLRNRGTGGYLAINSNGALVTVSSTAKATQWQLSAQAEVQSTGLFYPGCEKDRTNKLVAQNSSFPIRGVITSAKTITKVSVAVSGAGSFTASGTPNANWYDLWNLDGKCTFSQLAAGNYTLKITATADGETTTIAESKFTVTANSGPVVDDETFTVTLDANGGSCSKKSKTYKLGDVYGNLPDAKKCGYDFVGWFLEDGTEASASTPVAAKDHKLIAKYGDLYTVTFLKEDGSELKTVQLAKGELITAPTSPVKTADSKYTYSFNYWQDAKGNKFVAGATYMDKANIVYSPVFSKAEITSGGTGTEPEQGTTTVDTLLDGGYLKGITPNTSVSSLSSSGYKVYDIKGSQISGGNLATGMTAVTGNVQVILVVIGDANGDGKLTITDVVKLQSHVVGRNKLSGAYAKAADINGDGSVTITDVVQAAQITVGKRSLS